jgi:hypothetical protein
MNILAVVTLINDASTLISALTPLVNAARDAGETEVSDAEIEAARARLVGNLVILDALIAKAP